MKEHITRRLRLLRRLKCSAGFKTSVLAAIISVQAGQTERYKRASEAGSRLLPGACGRQWPEFEPVGFSSLPPQPRPVVERFFHFGGEGHEHETPAKTV